MPSNLNVSIVSVEGLIFSGVADMVHATAENGEIGILPKHTPFLSTIKPSTIKIDSGNEEKFFYISGGVVEVQPYAVTFLADTVIRVEDLDMQAAENSQQQAIELLGSTSSQPNIDIATASLQLTQAIAQLESIRKFSDSARKRGLMK